MYSVRINVPQAYALKHSKEEQFPNNRQSALAYAHAQDSAPLCMPLQLLTHLACHEPSPAMRLEYPSTYKDCVVRLNFGQQSNTLLKH